MQRWLRIRHRAVLGGFLVALAVATVAGAVVIAIAEGVAAAWTLILVGFTSCFNCWLFFSGRAFPPRD